MGERQQQPAWYWIPLALFGAVLFFAAQLFMPRWAVDAWPNGLALLTTYVLFVTLVVVWCYTWHTARMVDAVNAQFGVAREQLRLDWLELRRTHKPFVVTRRGGGGRLYVKNLAPSGIAVNVYILPFDHLLTFQEADRAIDVGPLGPQEEREVAHVTELEIGGALMHHVVLAEGILARTQQWTPTLCRVRTGNVIPAVVTGIPTLAARGVSTHS